MRQGPQTVRTIFGLLLTGLGVLFLVDSLGVYRLDYSAFWPVFPLGVGLSFLAVHLLDRTPATRWALIPGCLVTVVGLILFLIAFRLADLSLFWPVFPFGVGLAFLLMYALGIRERSWPLYPGVSLTALGVVFFVSSLLGWRWWPLILITIGLITLVRRH